MKKILLLLSLVLTSPLSYAQEATGTIDELRVCGYNGGSGARWARVVQFKVAGKWFGIYADYMTHAHDNDNNLMVSMLMMAYSQQQVVQINATDSWNSGFSKCGTSSSGAVLHDNPGDYIRLSTSL
ncbi:hypothetical protein VISI1226_21629 [Vibrio sinaloensis DSM 21326]|uniref:Uncharacterized protein n=1 Tax=Vibrio sinaloensis DSM 21326 TaxID=945550 RepID=E8MBP6_PHOS4|nr:hypothetical protein [Vibrio sinaloensis]EGA68632.1 hypothetical protein VISI1226_21629 [Vibrio sinaloensis DSM 21326]